jgi:translation elongation factor EF-1alpha
MAVVKPKKPKKSIKPKKPVKKELKEPKELGIVTHYFDHIGVAVVKLKAELKKGDKIHIKGHTTDFVQVVKSMQIEHDKIEKAAKGKEIGLKVDDAVREHDILVKE